MNSPEIEELKRLVKEKYEDTLATSTDFEVFSLMLKKKYNYCCPVKHKRA